MRIFRGVLPTVHLMFLCMNVFYVVSLGLEPEAAAETDVRTVDVVPQHMNLNVVDVPITIGAQRTMVAHTVVVVIGVRGISPFF